jgi:hypothetical protein
MANRESQVTTSGIGQPQVMIVPRPEEDLTKSTFDALIAALKQGRATARE